jgi:DnaK suppressor protein
MKRAEILEFLKTHFLDEKQRIMNSAANQNKAFSSSTQTAGKDDGDIASQSYEQGMQLQMINRDLLYLKKIDTSLDKMDSGEFGMCESCEEDIENQRLMARPTASLCITCKEEEERLENATIDGKRSKSFQRSQTQRASAY